ncbi:site-2 protease family protein [Candidatus Parcubacteria bacterium]|nr:site-2 protease family protein [Candidatus Parcubacteria bacterium]
MEIAIFSLIVLLISASFHEFMHGWVAYKLGDNTAKDAGRLTMNPISHIDPVFSIILPLLLFVTNSPFLFGGAKPVPYNPYNLRDRKFGDLKVALGGPVANLILALFFGGIARILPLAEVLKYKMINFYFRHDYSSLLIEMRESFMATIFVMSIIFCFINLMLMIFNLLPIPPLDGSKIILPFLSSELKMKYYKIEPFGFFILIFLLSTGALSFIWYILLFLFQIIIGL